VAEQESQRKLSDDQIWDKLHISGNYRMDARGRQHMLDAGLKLLNETLAKVESFSALSPETKHELVMQKKNWGQQLTREEEAFGIESGLT